MNKHGLAPPYHEESYSMPTEVGYTCVADIKTHESKPSLAALCIRETRRYSVMMFGVKVDIIKKVTVLKYRWFRGVLSRSVPQPRSTLFSC